jgi:hypothetical protein
MTAIRSVYAAEGKFVQISNAALQDRRLSLKARGILAFVLSLPPDQHLTAAWVESQVREGRESVRAAFRELAECGYYRCSKKQDENGRWIWEQVISDAPAADEARTGEDSSVGDMSICGFPSDGEAPDGKPSDKELNTNPKNEDQKMAQERASRRAQASGSRAKRTVPQIIAEVREAVATAHGQQEADDLTDGEVLGLYFKYGNPKKPARELVAYMAKILADAPYLDTFMANVEAVCIPCWHYESDCKCPAASAA